MVDLNINKHVQAEHIGSDSGQVPMVRMNATYMQELILLKYSLLLRHSIAILPYHLLKSRVNTAHPSI